MAELLFWPALLAYGEAAVAYAGDARRPGSAGRLATWGVRLGWLLQTALLVVQAARADGFPWATWAGSLNLFVWLVVTVYLVWGCRTPLPAARPRGDAAGRRAARARARSAAAPDAGAAASYSTLFLVLHVGLVSFAFAAFTLAAALCRRSTSGRSAGSSIASPAACSAARPSLLTLETLTGRTIAVALPALTVGIVAGLVRLRARRRRGRRADGRHARHLGRSTPRYLLLRYEAGWRGRRAAYLALAGFALVIVARARPPAHPLLVNADPRRPLTPVDARRGARARLRRRSTQAGELARDARRRAARPSASRPATARSSTSSATTPRRGGARRARRGQRPRRGRAARQSSTGSRDEAAALHLFRVAAGLDSMVPGEGEILGQVREAFEAGAPGPILDRLFRQALHAGKKVRAETAIGESPASVSSAAAALAAAGVRRPRRLPGPARRRRARRRARRAEPRRARGGDRLRRQPLARSARASSPMRFGGAAIPLERASPSASRDVDVARLGSTGAPGARSAASDVEAALRSRKGRPLFLIDLAVPRDLDPAIHELDGCYLYDIDDLESVVAAEPRRPSPRGGAGGGDRRRRGRALPRVAGVARGRPGDRVAARVGRGGPRSRARARPRTGSGSPRPSERGGRVGDRPDRRQAAPPADGAPEGGRRRRERRQLRRGRAAPVRPRRRRADAPARRLARQPPRADAGVARVGAPSRPGARDRARPDHDRRRPRPARSRSARSASAACSSRSSRRRCSTGGSTLAVHSAKDMTSTDTAGLAVGAYLPREDPRDALCGAAELRPGMRVGTASVRRRAQLLALEPELSIEPLRGNIDTRLRKRGERGLDAVVLAACGLDRLGLAGEIGLRFEPAEMLPEAGQGALAIQVRAGEEELVAAADDAETRRRVEAERACVAAVGGGCLAPVAAHHDGSTLVGLDRRRGGALARAPVRRRSRTRSERSSHGWRPDGRPDPARGAERARWPARLAKSSATRWSSARWSGSSRSRPGRSTSTGTTGCSLTSATGAEELRRRATRPAGRRSPRSAARPPRPGARSTSSPRVSTQEGLLAELPRPAGRVLFAAAEGARRLLADELGADFVALYRTTPLGRTSRPKAISPCSRRRPRPARSQRSAPACRSSRSARRRRGRRDAPASSSLAEATTPDVDGLVCGSGRSRVASGRVRHFPLRLRARGRLRRHLPRRDQADRARREDHRHHARDRAAGRAPGRARAREHAAVHARGRPPRRRRSRCGRRPARARAPGHKRPALRRPRQRPARSRGGEARRRRRRVGADESRVHARAGLARRSTAATFSRPPRRTSRAASTRPSSGPRRAVALVRLELPEPEVGEATIRATVLYVDRFGNVQLNLSRADVECAGIVPGRRSSSTSASTATTRPPRGRSPTPGRATSSSTRTPTRTSRSRSRAATPRRCSRSVPGDGRDDPRRYYERLFRSWSA